MQLPIAARSALAASLRGERDMRRENRGPSASAPTPGRYQHRGGGFPGKAGPSQGHPRTRGRPLLLLCAADHPAQAVPRPCCAASGVGTEFLSKPGVLLSGMQLAKSGALGRGVSARALPRPPLERRRTECPPPLLRRSRRRQAHSPHPWSEPGCLARSRPSSHPSPRLASHISNINIHLDDKRYIVYRSSISPFALPEEPRRRSHEQIVP